MNLKKMIALLLALVMTAALCACASGDAASVGIIGGADGPTSILVADKAAAIDRDAVAVTVGNREITVGEVADMYDNMIYQYETYGSYYGVSVPTADADIETLQDEVVAMLVEQEMLLYMAEQLGCAELSAEQEEELAATVQEEIDSVISYYQQNVTIDSEDAEELRAAAIELINQALLDGGWGMDFDGYCAEMEQSYRESYHMQNLEEKIKAEASIEEADAQSYYDLLLTEHRELVATDALNYIDGQESYEMNGGEPMLVVPEGYVRVKVLTVEPKEALDAEYDTLITEMEALEAEYGKLALTKTDAARQNEIKTAYAEKKTASDTMWEAYVAESRKKAEEAYEKLCGGESFDSVFAAYGEDVTYTEYPVFGEKGCLMYTTQDDGMWDEAIRTAAAGLKVGEYSKIIEIEGSYHIVYVVSEEVAGEIAYEDVKDEMHTLALEQRQATRWEEAQEGWMEQEGVVTYHQDTYRAIGKN